MAQIGRSYLCGLQQPQHRSNPINDQISQEFKLETPQLLEFKPKGYNIWPCHYWLISCDYPMANSFPLKKKHQVFFNAKPSTVRLAVFFWSRASTPLHPEGTVKVLRPRVTPVPMKPSKLMIVIWCISIIYIYIHTVDICFLYCRYIYIYTVGIYIYTVYIYTYHILQIFIYIYIYISYTADIYI